MEFRILTRQYLYLLTEKKLVYGIYRDNKYVYIGKTNKGIARLLDSRHSLNWFHGGILVTDQIHFWFDVDINKLELSLIKLHKPIYNKMSK